MSHIERSTIQWDLKSKLSFRKKWTTLWVHETGMSKIPRGKVLITLGGASYKDINNPSLSPQSELAYLLRMKLLSPSQYYSVESDMATQMGNEMIPKGNWLYGDMSDTFKRMVIHEGMDPAIVNFDCCNMDRTSHHEIIEMLHIMNKREFHQFLFVYNVTKQAHHLLDTEIGKLLYKDTRISSLLKGWKTYEPYEYKGKATPMCSFFFYRP